MARPLRVEYPGAYYHVINRGNAGEDIFHSIRDREKFLEYLEKAVERFSIIVHTYCLMTTHYHLLIETPQPNLSVAIQWLNVSYAAYYNKKRKRSGHPSRGGSSTFSRKIEAPRSKLRGIFDRKEVCYFQIRSLTPQQAAWNAFAFAVQVYTGGC